MLRKTFVALLALLLIATASPAAIILQSSNYTYEGSGLLSYIISAVGTAGEVINTFQDPFIFGTNGGPGPHEVWPISNQPTATKKDQDAIGSLFYPPSYANYDTYFLVPGPNYLEAGPAWSEANNGATTGTLQVPTVFNLPPKSGFGAYGGQTNATKALTVGAGSNVPFLHVVTRVFDNISMNVLIFANSGTVQQQFTNVPSPLTPPIGPSPLATHKSTLAMPGDAVASVLEGFSLDQSHPGLTWSNFTFAGPNPAVQPSFDYATQQFNWDTTGSAFGQYVASVKVTQTSAPNLNSTATFTINVVPEPSTFTLLALALLSCLVRRRHKFQAASLFE